jgi:hypothetical protein
MKIEQADRSYPPNPFVAVWPGQDIAEAIATHTRLTGCRGPFFVEFLDVGAAGESGPAHPLKRR